jgi:hypothetical protein
LGAVVGTDTLNDIPVSFTISGADIATANNIAVGVDATAISGGAKITATGDGSDSAAFFNIKGAGATTVSVSGDDVTVSSVDTHYGIEATTNDNKAQIILTSDIGNDAITL